MRYLKQNTATVITVGPFLDVTDGVTPEVALTVTNDHLTLMVDNAGTPTLALDADATGSSGDNDMVHITNDDAGMYSLELTAANLNYVGGAILAIIDTDVHLPVFHEFTILPANVYDSLIAGSDALQVHANEITNNLITAAAIADGAIDAATFAAGAINAAAIADAAIDAATFAAGAIDAAAIATGAIDADAIADNAIDAGAIAADAITAAKIADAAIDAATFAAGAINAAAIADAAIDAATFAADVDAEVASYVPTAAAIADAVWDEASTGHVDAGKAGAQMWTDVDAILADTNELQTDDYPTTLASMDGKLDTIDDFLDTEVAAILEDTGTTIPGILGAPAGASLAADIAAIEAQTDDIGAAGAGLTAIPWNSNWDAEVQSEVDDAIGAQLADSVPADGAIPTLKQAIYMIVQFLTERSVSGTTVTVRKVDGSTALMTFTLSDATSPVSITRAT